MRESRWQQFDFVIVACVLGLVLAGVAMIHSATCGSPCAGLLPPSSYAVRQGVSAAFGFALLIGVSLIDYRFYRVYAYHLFGFAVALLVIVLIIGRGGADNDYGAKRWIYLASLTSRRRRSPSWPCSWCWRESSATSPRAHCRSDG